MNRSNEYYTLISGDIRKVFIKEHHGLVNLVAYFEKGVEYTEHVHAFDLFKSLSIAQFHFQEELENSKA